MHIAHMPIAVVIWGSIYGIIVTIYLHIFLYGTLSLFSALHNHYLVNIAAYTDTVYINIHFFGNSRWIAGNSSIQ